MSVLKNMFMIMLLKEKDAKKVLTKKYRVSKFYIQLILIRLFI